MKLTKNLVNLIFGIVFLTIAMSLEYIMTLQFLVVLIAFLGFVFYTGYIKGKAVLEKEKKLNCYIDDKKRLKNSFLNNRKFFICLILVGVIAFFVDKIFVNIVLFNQIESLNFIVIAAIIIPIAISRIHGYIIGNLRY